MISKAQMLKDEAEPSVSSSREEEERRKKEKHVSAHDRDTDDMKREHRRIGNMDFPESVDVKVAKNQSPLPKIKGGKDHVKLDEGRSISHKAQQVKD